jgi:hypothetical protein
MVNGRAMADAFDFSAGVENVDIVSRIKARFAPDGAAAREHNARGDSLGFGAIHYGLVTNLKPERALVIGSRHGYVPAIIALALELNGAGALDFVDASYTDAVHGFDRAYGGVGHWNAEASPFAACNLTRVTMHVVRSAEFFEHCDATYQYIYLDGDHSYDGCRFDFEQAALRADEGAVIALHDVRVTDPVFGVRRLFDELDPARYGKLLVPAWPGLGIVQIRKPEA